MIPANPRPNAQPHPTARRTSFHNVLAFFVTLAFFVVCVLVICILVTSTETIEAAAAGILGAILGYWANNLTQIVSYYYGSAAPAQASEASRAGETSVSVAATVTTPSETKL